MIWSISDWYLVTIVIFTVILTGTGCGIFLRISEGVSERLYGTLNPLILLKTLLGSLDMPAILTATAGTVMPPGAGVDKLEYNLCLGA